MYEFVRSVIQRRSSSLRVAPLGISMVVAELFYKLHSFTLECMAFLATWFVLDAAMHWVLELRAVSGGARPAAETSGRLGPS